MPIDRPALRRDLLARRDAFARAPESGPAGDALARHLLDAVRRHAPRCLGLYAAMRSEFNAAPALVADAARTSRLLALPCARRADRRMDYRVWTVERDGAPPSARDDFGIPTGGGETVVPDLVLAPCIGFTRAGHRLGYGGGFYDRWLAEHPATVAIGIAWSWALLPPGAYEPEAHDVPLAAVVTEAGVLPAC